MIGQTWKQKGGGKFVCVYDLDYREDAVFYFDRDNPTAGFCWMSYDDFVSDFKPVEDEKQ